MPEIGQMMQPESDVNITVRDVIAHTHLGRISAILEPARLAAFEGEARMRAPDGVHRHIELLHT